MNSLCNYEFDRSLLFTVIFFYFNDDTPNFVSLNLALFLAQSSEGCAQESEMAVLIQLISYCTTEFPLCLFFG